MSEFKVESNLTEVLSLMIEEEKLIKEAMEIANKYIGAVESGQWEGETKKSFLLYNQVTILYHDNILFLIESLKKHTLELIKDVDDFPQISSNMRSLKG